MVRGLPRRVRLGWRRYLVLAGAGAVVVALLPVGPVRYLVLALVALTAAGAVGAGIRRHRPERPAAWYLVGVALSGWVLGDLLYFWPSHLDTPAPPGWVASLAFVVAYGAAITGLVILIGSRGRLRRSTSRLDTALLVVNLGVVAWVLVVEPLWSREGLSVVDRVTGTAYVIGDVVLVGAAARVAASSGVRNSAGRLILGAVVLTVVSDALHQVYGAQHATALQLGWLAGYVLWAAAALHPAMRSLSDVDAVPEGTLSPGRVALLAAVVLSGPAALAGLTLAGGNPSPWPVLVTAPVVVGLVAARMVLVLRRLAEQSAHLARLAETDYVTGLPNRRRFVDDLAELLLREPSPGGVVLLIGLDRLAETSSLLGHRTTDDLLGTVARRLRAVAGPGVVVARTGTSTYAVLAAGLTQGQGAQDLARELRSALQVRYALTDASVSLEVCVGGAMLHPSMDAVSTYRRAEDALAAAGDSPERVVVDISGPDLTEATLSRIQAGLDAGEFVLHYQAQVDLATGRVVGVEALARWAHPEQGVLSPAAFIPVVERSHLIGAFTRFAVSEAVAQCARWRSAGLDLVVSVNLSARNLLDASITDDVGAILAEHSLPPSALDLELTESSAMVDPHRSRVVVSALAALGVTLSVDDYGTGYSSLAYLHTLPVHRLKIDRSFVARSADDALSRVIVRSTVELSRNLGLEVVAEGVEDDRTLLWLRDAGCDVAQGFGIAPPVPADAVADVVAEVEPRIRHLLTTTSTVRELVRPVRQTG